MIGAIRRDGWQGWWLCSLLVLAAGCESPPPQPLSREVRVVAQVSQEVRNKLLDGALAVLGNLENYEEESATAQVFDRLNQWIHADPVGDEAASAEWRPDPLIESLPEEYLLLCDAERLGSAVFDAGQDVVALRDQRWLADIAKTNRGDAVDDLDIATALFRWTIRFLAIESEPPFAATPKSSGDRWFERGEILLAGRGSPIQRSWIFLELLRQSGLHGVMLATVDADGGLRPWVPALISGGEAYLFEPTYGLPIPAADGLGVATVRQAAAEPVILERLGRGGRPYPVTAADMQDLGILVAADPEMLSRRMALVEKNLVGASALRLAINATIVGELAAASLPATDPPVGLWQFPFEVRRRRLAGTRTIAIALARELAGLSVAMDRGTAGRSGVPRGLRRFRPLYAGKLREFRGDFEGPEGAKKAYLLARPSRSMLNELLPQVPPAQREAVSRLYEQMKEDATYWLGLLTLAEGDYETAIDYLGRMTLEATPDGRWAAAARLNLAEAYAEAGSTAEAVALLNADRSPQRFGSRLRAELLTAGVNPSDAAD